MGMMAASSYVSMVNAHYFFGEVKSRREQYTGEEGLKNAVSKLRDFKDVNQRFPKVREKGLSGIKGAVYRGE